MRFITSTQNLVLKSKLNKLNKQFINYYKLNFQFLGCKILIDYKYCYYCRKKGLNKMFNQCIINLWEDAAFVKRLTK